MGDQELTSDKVYFRASNSKISFVVPALKGGMRGLSLKDRAVALLLLIIARHQRKKESQLFGKIEAAILADDQASLMILYARLADLYQTAFGHTATLLEVCEQSLRIAERLHEWHFAAAMSYRAGECAWDLGMSSLAAEFQKKALNNEAVEFQKKALDYGERAGDQRIMADACERLGDLCRESDPKFSKQMVARYHDLSFGDEFPRRQAPTDENTPAQDS